MGFWAGDIVSSGSSIPDGDVGDGYEVQRFRRNDFVGAPIWGFRGFPADVSVGDRCYVDDNLFDPPHRTRYVVDVVDGRLACTWATRWDRVRQRFSFAGFIDQ